MNTLRFLIYGYSDPRTGLLRYIGKDTTGGTRAKKIHAHEHGHVGNWIKNLAKEGLRPKIHVIQENVDPFVLRQAETFWIEYFRSLKFPLTNITDHGEGVWGIRQTEEHRLKVSQAMKGKKLSEIVVKSRVGKHHSESTRIKLSQAAKLRWKRSRT
jgi:hypothetical protein